MSDSDGDTVEKYTYDVFGRSLIRDASNINQTTSQFGNPYLFTARRLDTETSLYYYRARLYNPEIGRFMQTDPIGYDDGTNLYAYCGNNPIMFIDLYGLCKLSKEDFYEEMNKRLGELAQMDPGKKCIYQITLWQTQFLVRKVIRISCMSLKGRYIRVANLIII